ncbi:hypothetical protein [Streptomyces sp. NPDC003006]
MQLVHARVRLAVDPPEPERLRAIFRSHARRHEGIQHISIHPDADRKLTVGVYVTADSVCEAEDTARVFVTRTLECEYALRGARVAACSAALVPQFYDGLCGTGDDGGRSMRGPDQDTGQT